jgi:hypothetical protein
MANTVELGHLLDRVVLVALTNSPHYPSPAISGEEGGEVVLPLSFFWTLLSLALHELPEHRIQFLFDALRDETNLMDEAMKPVVTRKQVERLVEHLQQTSQLVAETQIVDTEVKYPIPESRVGTAAELVSYALEGDEEDSPSSNDLANNPDLKFTARDLGAVLQSYSVCAWGECYIKKKKPYNL